MSEDKIAKKLMNQPNAKKEENKVKIATENYYIKYNTVNKHLSLGFTTVRGHKTMITLTPSYVIIKVPTSDGDYIKFKIRKSINIHKFVVELMDEIVGIETALKNQGIEVE